MDGPSEYVAHNCCETCKHRTSAINCTAFPQGIPSIILAGVYDHRHHFSMNGMGDGYLLYEPKTDPHLLINKKQEIYANHETKNHPLARTHKRRRGSP
jgi:hypothetical protein